MLIDNITFFNLYNLIYFCTACLVVMSALSMEVKKDIFFQNRLSQYLVLLPLISLIFIVGFREYNVGTDTLNYYNLLWVNNLEINFSGEFLFNLIALLFRGLDLGFNFFLLLISSFFYIFLYKSLKIYSEIYKSNLLISFFICISFFFFLSTSINIIRQGLSLVFLMLAFSFWIKRGGGQKIIFLILFSLALHSTSLIPVLIFLFCTFILKFKVIYLFILFYFVSILLAYLDFGLLNISPLFLEFLGQERRVGYLSDDGAEFYEVGFKPQFVIFNTLFLFLFLYIRENILDFYLKDKYSILLGYYIISSIIFFMAFDIAFSDRWGLFSWLSIPFLVIPLFYSPFVKGGIKIHYILMFIVIYVGFNLYVL